VPHPAFITGEHLDLLDDRFRASTLEEAFHCRLVEPDTSPERRAELARLMGTPNLV
jgi:hypothetical protein